MPANVRSARSAARPPVLAAEALERRAMFAVTPDPGNSFADAYFIGDLNGKAQFEDAVGSADGRDVYKFNMPRPGTFHGRLRAYQAQALVTLFRETAGPGGVILPVPVVGRIATQTGPDGGFSSGDLPAQSLPAGTYYLRVETLADQDTSYLARMTADYAGQEIATARDLGVAADETVRDFVGTFDIPSTLDTADFYKVRMESAGSLFTNLRLDPQDPAFHTAHVDVIRDANGNGQVDAGEVIGSSPVGANVGTQSPLAAGTYFLRVVPDLGIPNYALRVNADYGVGGIREVGSVDAGRTFTDFVANQPDPYADAFDWYGIDVSATRPLHVAVSQEGEGTSVLALYHDINNDGVPQAHESVASTIAASFNQLLTTVQPGRYIVEVRAWAGAGRYTLHAQAKPDAAGNTPAAARNLGTVAGLRRLDDYVSAADAVDYYKFTAAAAGTLSAQLNPYVGNSADLALIRDANNNGRVDPGEVLAASALPSNAADRVTRSIPAGTYFLRVTGSDANPTRYGLTFHTDHAGGTVGTARNVGPLAGTRTFNDWASGDYGSGISDTRDVYKFTLGSARTFKAAMTGELGGEDLNLELFRDANGDGVLSANERLAFGGKPDTANEGFTKSLGAGTYFVRVIGVNGDTNYKLSLTA